ncbi:MAG: hypothetical protein E7173_01580 [Firmicutes bacterium]|nr:hypothetical protein [Bacillota bacterium]
MKIEKLSDDNFIVFLNKLYFKDSKFELPRDFEIYFKGLFKRLGSFYNINVSGYYDINIYYDKIYGYVLDIKKEAIDFYDYYDDHIDMKISIDNNQKFLFKLSTVSVLNERVVSYCHLFRDNNDIYALPKKTITQQLLGHLIENSCIIYGNKAERLIRHCKDIKTKQLFV